MCRSLCHCRKWWQCYDGWASQHHEPPCYILLVAFWNKAIKIGQRLEDLHEWLAAMIPTTTLTLSWAWTQTRNSMEIFGNVLLWSYHGFASAARWMLDWADLDGLLVQIISYQPTCSLLLMENRCRFCAFFKLQMLPFHDPMFWGPNSDPCQQGTGRNPKGALDVVWV